MKGHRYWSNGNAHAFACIAITPEGKWYRFDSITQAAQKLNLNYATVRRYIKRKIKPQNGWLWLLIMGKLNEIAQKAYECAVRRGKIDPDNDSNNNLHRDLLEEVAEVFECTGEKSPHIKEYLDVEEELADVIIVALSTLHHFKCDIDSLIEAKMNYNKNRMD